MNSADKESIRKVEKDTMEEKGKRDNRAGTAVIVKKKAESALLESGEKGEKKAEICEYRPTVEEKEALDICRVLKAIADPIRFAILNMLYIYEGLVSVSDLTAAFPKEQPTISHHLRILLSAKLIWSVKHGLFVYYYVEKGNLESAFASIDIIKGKKDE